MINLKKIVANIFLLVMLATSIVANAQQQDEPIIKEIFFTNTEGERITGTVSLDEKIVFLNIATQNAIGQKVTITMDEDEAYFYEKKFLSGGSSFKILIKQNLQKVKLVIYNPYKKKHVKRKIEVTGAAPAEDAR